MERGSKCGATERFIYYRKYIQQITQPSPYRCTQLQYRFAVISEAPSMLTIMIEGYQRRAVFRTTVVRGWDSTLPLLNVPFSIRLGAGQG